MSVTLISAPLIKWCVDFRDLNFHDFRPKLSIHSRKEKNNNIVLLGRRSVGIMDTENIVPGQIRSLI